MIKDTTDQADDEEEHKEFSAWFLHYENEFVIVNRPKLKVRRRKSGVTRLPGSKSGNQVKGGCCSEHHK